MTTKKEQMIANDILRAYERNIYYLPQKKIGHFFQRAYRITGDDKYITTLTQHFFIKQVILLKHKLQILREYVDNGTDIKITSQFPQDDPRKKSRYLIYKQKPEIPFFNALLLDLFLLYSTKLYSSCCVSLYKELFNLLKKVDFYKMYYDEHTILNVSSFAINSVTFLDHLSLDKKNLKQQVITLIKNYYLDKDLHLIKKLNKWEYHSFIYDLTHILIAESGFYEKSVTKHRWITSYFAKNTQEIIDRTTMDITVEVALCFKLTKQTKEYAHSLKKIKKHIHKNYDFQKMLSLKNIEKKEHTNSILMLLFFQNNTWRKGPDLSQEAIFNNLTLK